MAPHLVPRPIRHGEVIPSHEINDRRREAHQLLHTKHAPFIHRDSPDLIKSKADTDPKEK